MTFFILQKKKTKKLKIYQRHPYIKLIKNSFNETNYFFGRFSLLFGDSDAFDEIINTT
jgi:hypothetical protein